MTNRRLSILPSVRVGGGCCNDNGSSGRRTDVVLPASAVMCWTCVYLCKFNLLGTAVLRCFGLQLVTVAISVPVNQTLVMSDRPDDALFRQQPLLAA